MYTIQQSCPHLVDLRDTLDDNKLELFGHLVLRTMASGESSKSSRGWMLLALPRCNLDMTLEQLALSMECSPKSTTRSPGHCSHGRQSSALGHWSHQRTRVARRCWCPATKGCLTAWSPPTCMLLRKFDRISSSVHVRVASRRGREVAAGDSEDMVEGDVRDCTGHD
jgi:hypothetical protein